MKKITRTELNSTNFITATDARKRKIVRTVSINGFQVGIDDPEYKAGLLVWGGVDLPTDVAPDITINKLYTDRNSAGHGVIKYDDLPIGSVSSDFLRKKFTDQLDTNECYGDIVRYIVGDDEELNNAYAYHYASDGRWKLSRANYLDTHPNYGLPRPPLNSGEADYQEGNLLCLAYGKSAINDGMMLRGFARISPGNIHNIPSNVKASAVYLSADIPGHLDFEPTTVRVGIAIDRDEDTKGDVLIYFDHTGTGVQGEPGGVGITVEFSLSASRNYFEQRNNTYVDLGDINLRVRRRNIVGTDGDKIKWYVRNASGTFALVSNDDFLKVDPSDPGNNIATMSSTQFEALRVSDAYVVVKAEITDSTDGTVYSEEQQISLTVVNDGVVEPILILRPNTSTFIFDSNNISPSPDVNFEALLLNIGTDPYTVTWSSDVTPNGNTATMSSTQYLNATSNLADQQVTVTATALYNGNSYSANAVVNHILNRNPSLNLTSDAIQFVTNNATGTTTPSIINFTAVLEGLNPNDVIWMINNIDQNNNNLITRTTNTATMNKNQFNTASGGSNSVKVSAKVIDSGITYISSVTIFSISFGSITLSEDPLIQIESGNFCSLVLTKSGKVYGWGVNAFWVLGDKNTTPGYSNPYPPPPGDPIPPIEDTIVTSPVLLNEGAKKIQAGHNFSGILSQDGKLYIAGWNNKYRTMLPNDGDYQRSFTQIFDNIKDFALGYDFGIAVDNDNRIITWGNNSKGQCAFIYNSSADQFGISASSAVTEIDANFPFEQTFSIDLSPSNNSDGFYEFIDEYQNNIIDHPEDYDISVYAGVEHAALLIVKKSNNEHYYVTWGSTENGALGHVSAKGGVSGTWVDQPSVYTVSYTNWAPRRVRKTNFDPIEYLKVESKKLVLGNQNNALIDESSSNFGKVWVWGRNQHRNIQPGNPTNNILSPQLIEQFDWPADQTAAINTGSSSLFGSNSRLGPCLKIALNSYMIAAITESGIYAWGMGNSDNDINSKHQFGRGLSSSDPDNKNRYVENGSRAEPGFLLNYDDINEFEKFKITSNRYANISMNKFASTSNNSLIVSPRGTLVWAWGYNPYNFLGIGNLQRYPKAVIIKNFDAILGIDFYQQINLHNPT